ncbi:MAG: response regulator transcription factor [Actinobacteria bacterium]|nr:response regulator transcription factor [Actinomycetota bacterium]
MADSRPVTVVLARFEDLVGAGLRSLIADDPNLRVVAADVPLADLSAAIAEHAPRVALLNFGTLRAPAEIRRLTADHPDTRLVVLANHPTPGECAQLLALGATACLGKRVEGRDVLNTIHLASRGLHVLPHATPATPGAPLLPDVLTPREAEVLDQLQLGRSNAEIAMALSVSIETVRTHASSVFRKLGVKGRRELARGGSYPRGPL